MFLGNNCLGKACYKNCKYKYNHSSADIRIGDCWGTKYQADEDGVSAAIVFTEKGNFVLNQCNCTLVEYPFAIVAEGQIKKGMKLPKGRNLILALARCPGVSTKTLALVSKINSFFVGSPESGVRFARLQSVFANIRNHKLNAVTYLCDVFRRIGKTAKEELVNLLPHKWQPMTV